MAGRRRTGSPRFVALNHVALGDSEEPSRRHHLDHCEPTGRETAEMIDGSAHRSPQSVEEAIAGGSSSAAEHGR